jgi:hypothetical protein
VRGAQTVRAQIRDLSPGRRFGVVLLASQFAAVSDGETTRDGTLGRLPDVSRPAPDLISATIKYVADDRRWMQTFTAVRLDEASSAPR